MSIVILPVPVKDVAARVGELLTVKFKLLGAVTVTFPALSQDCKSRALMLDLLVKLRVPALTKGLLAARVALPLSTKVPAVMVVVPV